MYHAFLQVLQYAIAASKGQKTMQIELTAATQKMKMLEISQVSPSTCVVMLPVRRV